MACFRCGRRQTDPVKGASPWARMVVGTEQVLLCPECQQLDPDWKGLGERCPECDSPRLVVVMDAIVCKACGRDFERTTFAGPRG